MDTRVLEQSKSTPDKSFEQWIPESSEYSACNDLRPKARSFRDSTGNNCGDAGGKSRQEKTMEQIEPARALDGGSVDHVHQRPGVRPKGNAIGNGESDQKICDR